MISMLSSVFRMVPVMLIPFFLVFTVVIGIFIFVFVTMIRQWRKNNNSPRLSVTATLVAKRTHMSHSHRSNMHTTHSTSYYATFQVESGDRMEFCIMPGEYGLLIEGDTGILTFQGTRYLGFERH